MRLQTEAKLTEEEAVLYLELLEKGSVGEGAGGEASSHLIARGMAIVSGDGKRVIPVHPRLGIANQYRTWREAMVKEINERRMRIDKLILELIPKYDAATDKRPSKEGE